MDTNRASPFHLNLAGVSSLRRMLLNLQRLIQRLRPAPGSRPDLVLLAAQADVSALQAELHRRQSHPRSEARDRNEP